MDTAQIVAIVMGAVLPLGAEALKEAVKSGAGAAGKDVGTGIVSTLKTFLGRKNRVDALDAVQAAPDDQDARGELVHQIERLAGDPEFIPAMTAAIEGLPPGVRQKLEVAGKIEGDTRQSARSGDFIDQEIKAGEITGNTVQDADNR